jgi:hypothetical protein
MQVAQERLGLKDRYPGAPPSVPASVVAWLADRDTADKRSERAELNGTTVSAQRFARQRGLHQDWWRPG